VAADSAPGFPKTPLCDAPIHHGTKAGPLVDALIEQIRGTQGPFIAFAHFKETHDAGAYKYVPEVFPARHLSRYDDGMFEVDRHVGRLIAALKASGRYDDTVIVFSADHGEFFGEHARMHHGSLLYEPVVRVPFAIKLPGVPARREATFVSGFDLAPTVFKAATGWSWPMPVLGGDVLGEIEAGRNDRAVFMENVSGQRGVRRVVAVRKGRFKYILLRGTSVEELFDVERDPGELDNLAGEEPEALAAMRDELDRVLQRQGCELHAMRAPH
jgi:arylsulfatase A-like enzyme